MFANAKSSRIGLASLLVVLSVALGGCAETVTSEPANSPLHNRNAITLWRMGQPEVRQDNAPEVKRVALVSHADAKLITRPSIAFH